MSAILPSHHASQVKKCYSSKFIEVYALYSRHGIRRKKIEFQLGLINGTVLNSLVLILKKQGILFVPRERVAFEFQKLRRYVIEEKICCYFRNNIQC